MSENSFDIILMDPPYSFLDKLNNKDDIKRSAAANYSTMSFDELKELKIKELASKDGAILCLWVPSSLLPEGLKLMESYGFIMKQTYIWNKIKKEPLKELFSTFKTKLKDLKSLKDVATLFNTTYDLNKCLSFGMGHLFRQTHEICLIGISNKKLYKKLKNKSQRSVCMAFNEKHSQKPDDLHKSLELMFSDSKKIELFSRKERDGWTTLGNHLDGKDINVSIQEVLDKED